MCVHLLYNANNSNSGKVLFFFPNKYFKCFYVTLSQGFLFFVFLSTFKNGIHIHICFFIYIWFENVSLMIISNFEFQRIREGKKMLLIGIFNLFIVLLLGLIFKTFCYSKSNSLQKKTNIVKRKF